MSQEQQQQNLTSTRRSSRDGYDVDDDKRPIMPKTEPSNFVSAEFIERRKAEIVSEMLTKIKPFVGSNGMIQPDADFDKLAKLMEGEVEFLGRTLLLTILLSSTAEPVKGGDEAKAIVFLLCDRLTKSPTIIGALQKWLTDASKAPEPICHLALKIFELIDRLHLTVDHLVQYKFGKLVKKILVREDSVTMETKTKAQYLFDKWSELAKTEETRRRSSGASSVTSTKPVSKAEDGAVENVSFFNEATGPKTRAALIIERAAKSNVTKTTPSVSTRYPNNNRSSVVHTCRPMSADDIHKAKKRRQYLQEAVATGQVNSEDLEQLGVQSTSPPPPGVLPDTNVNITPSDKPRKRVSFANEDELVKVHYIEPAYEQDEDDKKQVKRSLTEFKTKKGDYHHADRQEASYAFKRLQMEMEAEIEWCRPVDIFIQDEAIAPAHGEESVERQIQDARERQQVSAVYLSLDRIPPSPSETEPSLYQTPSVTSPKLIPQVCSSVQKVTIPDPSKKPVVDPNLLSAFLGNPTLLPGLARPPMPPPMFPPPPFPLHAPMPPPFPLHASIPPPFPLPPRPASIPIPGVPFMPPAVPPSGFFPNAVSRPPFPFPLPNAGMVRPPMMFQQRPNMLDPSQNPKLKTKPCKYYQAGQPGSCRFGDSCAFYHQD